MNVIVKKAYDWIVVGSGLYGSVFADAAKRAGKKVLVLERRAFAGGNIRCKMYNGVLMHCYGAHIFHTDRKDIWDFVNERAALQRIHHSPVAVDADGVAFPLPFNMYTFAQLWGVSSPSQAREVIAAQRAVEEVALNGRKPKNLEEQALILVGRDVFEKFIRSYTEKQWGRSCAELPPDIIRRIPIRMTFDGSYFDDPYVGVPPQGYNPLVSDLLDGVEVRTGIDWLNCEREYADMAENILFTGCIDEYYHHCLGRLDYRSLAFRTKIRDLEKSQGCSVVNWMSADVPYTRTIEHNFFNPDGYHEEIVVSEEYPMPYTGKNEPYYPVVDDKNLALYEKYRDISNGKVVFGGRLGLFRYLDMDEAIASALALARDIF